MPKVLIEGVLSSENRGAMAMLRGAEIAIMRHIFKLDIYSFSIEVESEESLKRLEQILNVLATHKD